MNTWKTVCFWEKEIIALQLNTKKLQEIKQIMLFKENKETSTDRALGKIDYKINNPAAMNYHYQKRFFLLKQIFPLAMYQRYICSIQSIVSVQGFSTWLNYTLIRRCKIYFLIYKTYFWKFGNPQKRNFFLVNTLRKIGRLIDNYSWL